MPNNFDPRPKMDKTIFPPYFRNLNFFWPFRSLLSKPWEIIYVVFPTGWYWIRGTTELSRAYINNRKVTWLQKFVFRVRACSCSFAPWSETLVLLIKCGTLSRLISKSSSFFLFEAKQPENYRKLNTVYSIFSKLREISNP